MKPKARLMIQAGAIILIALLIALIPVVAVCFIVGHFVIKYW